MRERSLRKKRNGEDFLRLTLADAPARCRRSAGRARSTSTSVRTPGAAVRVRGRFEIAERYGPQLTIVAIAPRPSGEYDPADLADGPPIDAGQMEADLRSLIETVRNPHLRAAARRAVRRGVRGLAALPLGAGGQVLPPGLRARAARAHADRGPGGQRRSPPPSPASTATSR